MMPRSRAAFAAALVAMLAGCGASKPTASPGPVLPLDRAVRGRVVAWGDTGFDATILIPGHAPQPVAAGETFTVDDVDVPYDLVVAANGRAWVYAGATRRDPLVTIPALGSTPRYTTFSLQAVPVQGTPGPSSTVRVSLAFGSPHLQWFATSTFAVPFVFDMDASWNGASTIHPTVHALHRANAVGAFPTDYYGYAEATIDLIDAARSPWPGLDLAPIPQVGRLEGRFVVPGDWVFDGTTVCLEWPDGAQLTLGTVTSTAFDLPTPGVGAGLLVLGGATGPGGESVGCSVRTPDLTTTGLEIPLPLTPAQVEPADAATGVGPATDFSWSDTRAGVKWLALQDATTHESVVTVLTTGSSARIPDLSALGVFLAPSTRYEWTVMSTAAPDVDAALAASAAGGCSATSAVRTFTTAAAP
ncbi:hypothetical protein [Anaeromyxobacter oryzae]|uniref:Uncharacterized protein n=1 Tax=Anaeromyxobacter oryzae TaxID=2918170 RepID=A0ABM7WV45_9BACT|nr:hypothetical protein [Anaeromyxobacter oryzae]BDG03337.1 hypothetical protein AMOR_23330 [Anaeromyxobacter oryzae]